MPLVDIEFVKGVFSDDQKLALIHGVTEAVVKVGGEAIREITWVRVQEFEQNQWAIGGALLTADDIKRRE